MSRPDLGLTPNLEALGSLLRLKVRHMEEEIEVANRLGWKRGRESASARRDAYALALRLLEDLEPRTCAQGR